MCVCVCVQTDWDCGTGWKKGTEACWCTCVCVCVRVCVQTDWDCGTEWKKRNLSLPVYECVWACVCVCVYVCGVPLPPGGGTRRVAALANIPDGLPGLIAIDAMRQQKRVSLGDDQLCVQQLFIIENEVCHCALLSRVVPADPNKGRCSGWRQCPKTLNE